MRTDPFELLKRFVSNSVDIEILTNEKEKTIEEINKVHDGFFGGDKVESNQITTYQNKLIKLDAQIFTSQQILLNTKIEILNDYKGLLDKKIEVELDDVTYKFSKFQFEGQDEVQFEEIPKKL